MHVVLNGKLIDHKKALINVSDHGFKFGDGIYETLRTVNGELWLFNEHMRRLRDSAKEVGIKVPYTNPELKNFIEKLIKKNGHKETRIRITLSRGSNNMDFATCKKPTLVIEATKLKKPKVSKGASAITFKIERDAPKIKSCSMISTVLARREVKKNNVFEALLIDNKGNITEGSFSNVFVVKSGKVYTPKDDMLEGTVRNLIIKKYKKVLLKNIKAKQIFNYDEVFITSTTNGVVPIITIDNKKIGSGKPGPITNQIKQLLPL